MNYSELDHDGLDAAARGWSTLYLLGPSKWMTERPSTLYHITDRQPIHVHTDMAEMKRMIETALANSTLDLLSSTTDNSEQSFVWHQDLVDDDHFLVAIPANGKLPDFGPYAADLTVIKVVKWQQQLAEATRDFEQLQRLDQTLRNALDVTKNGEETLLPEVEEEKGKGREAGAEDNECADALLKQRLVVAAAMKQKRILMKNGMGAGGTS